jgi:hypothetical protein
MIAKISSVLGFGLATALAGQAAAHDGRDSPPATYRAPAPSAPVYSPAGNPDGYRRNHPPAADDRTDYRADGRTAGELNELRRSDLNRDGWVTLAEAMQYGRRDFRRNDRDQNRVLTRREVSWGELARDDRDRNGGISYGEHQDAIRRSFYQFDTNRDGLLASYELRPSRGSRSATWGR